MDAEGKDRGPRKNKESLELSELNYLEIDLAVNALEPILHYVCSEMRRSAESGIGLWSFRLCELCRGFDRMLIMIY